MVCIESFDKSIEAPNDAWKKQNNVDIFIRVDFGIEKKLKVATFFCLLATTKKLLITKLNTFCNTSKQLHLIISCYGFNLYLENICVTDSTLFSKYCIYFVYNGVRNPFNSCLILDNTFKKCEWDKLFLSVSPIPVYNVHLI